MILKRGDAFTFPFVSEMKFCFYGPRVRYELSGSNYK